MTTRLIVGDTETTGKDDPRGVVEIAWVELDENLDIVEEVESLIDPQMFIHYGAIGVHGIYPEDVAGSPTLEEFFSVVKPNAFTEGDTVLIAHKVAFDEPFFKPYMPNHKVSICTLRLAKRFLPDAENFQLQTLKAQYLPRAKGQAHRALSDVHDCVGILKLIQQMQDKPLMELWRMAEVPQMLKTIEFGKHKGQTFSTIPRSYATWALANLKDMDIDLKFSLESITK